MRKVISQPSNRKPVSLRRFALLFVMLSGTALAANSTPLVGLFSCVTDTVPDIKFETAQLGKGMKDLKEQFHKAKEQLANVDWDGIDKQINAAMSKVNMDMVRQKTDLAKQQIDMKKMKETFAAIDFEKMKKDIAVNLDVCKKMNWDKIEKNINESLSKVDFSRIEPDMKKLSEQLAEQKVHLKVQLDGQLKNLDVQLEKVHHQLENMKRATDEMEKDGLIEKEKNHKIEFKSGDLYIDDKKQSDRVSEKYRHYFDKTSHKKMEMGNSETV